jgi:hypothetical protein
MRRRLLHCRASVVALITCHQAGAVALITMVLLQLLFTYYLRTVRTLTKLVAQI